MLFFLLSFCTTGKGMGKIFLHELRRLAPSLQGLTPSFVMLHNFGFSACTKKHKTTYLTLQKILDYVLLTSPLPLQQNNNDVKSWETANFLEI